MPTYEELATRFRSIFKRIGEDALRREQTRELPFEAVRWLRDAGFGAVRIPLAHGGAGASLPQLFRLLIELGEADSNLPQILRAHFAPEYILRRFSEGDENFDSYIKAFYQLVLLATLAGVARATLRDGIDFGRARTRAFAIPGKSSPLADPLVQRVVGRISSLSFAADSIVEGAAAALEQVYHVGLASITDEALYVGAEIKAFQAQQIVINLVLEATTLLFEVGGASATSLTRSLDRHWRNARTVASHNPAIYRERAIGDYYLNGQKPDAAWRALREKPTKGESPTNTTDSVSTCDDLSTEFDGKSQTSV